MHCKVHEYMTNIESKCPVCEITDLDILIAEKDATIARLEADRDEYRERSEILNHKNINLAQRLRAALNSDTEGE